MTAEPMDRSILDASSAGLGGPMARRQLHVIWILDCSGSMSVRGKVQALNNAIHESIPLLRSVAEDNVNADVLVRAVTFSFGAQWHLAEPTPVAAVRWRDVQADGVTDLGAALVLVAETLEVPPMPERALPPVLVLISDGQPTDDFQAGLARLLGSRWGGRSVRLAVAIGRDADLGVLQEFTGTGRAPVQANSPEDLMTAIRWVSTAIGLVSQPRASGDLAAPPEPGDDDVWLMPTS